MFGHGEKWGPLNHRGQLLRSRVEDALGVNAEASYKNTPFAWSPRGWGLFVHTAATVTHGVGHPAWSHRSYVLELEAQALDLFLLAGDDPAALLERYTWLTGRPPRPPRWSLGAWFSRAFYQDAAEVLDTARKLRARSIPADVILLDGQAWQDNQTRFRFEFDPARYPDPKAFLDELHGLDFKVCVWEYPMVSRRGPLFADLEAKGWLLRDRATGRAVVHDWGEASLDPLSPLQPSGLIDFTHPDAYAYWRDGHARLFELGVDVIKADFGEQVPADCVAHAALEGDELHNLYPLLYQRCVSEATARARGQGFVFARAGWAGSQRCPTHWGGDPQADWEALAASLRGALSWGLSGGACYATDVGGYLGPPEPELYVRWAQAAVFASHLRFHGTSPREPWAFGAGAEAVVRRWLESALPPDPLPRALPRGGRADRHAGDAGDGAGVPGRAGGLGLRYPVHVRPGVAGRPDPPAGRRGPALSAARPVARPGHGRELRGRRRAGAGLSARALPGLRPRRGRPPARAGRAAHRRIAAGRRGVIRRRYAARRSTLKTELFVLASFLGFVWFFAAAGARIIAAAPVAAGPPATPGGQRAFGTARASPRDSGPAH